jgi:large subunit ribosomal protein L4
MKAQIFDKKGKEIEKVDLPKEIFELPWNADLVHQVMVSMLSNSRKNTAHTKDRGEVRGGGKKPWRQKGTGRARHGSIRSPLWRGGGVTFGPRNERNYDRKINKKMKAKALSIVLSQKARDNELIFVDSLSLDEIKTKEAKNILDSISKNFEDFGKKRRKAAIIGLYARNENTEKSFRNIKKVRLDLVQNMNLIDLLNHKYLLIENPKESLEILKGRLIENK